MALTPHPKDSRRQAILKEIKDETNPQKLREQWNIGPQDGSVSAGKQRR